jgi:hypothetical protein
LYREEELRKCKNWVMIFKLVKQKCRHTGAYFSLYFRFTQATELATVALQGTPTTACLDALTTALCAYHFPRCEFDEKRFPAVCYDTCQTLLMQCKIELDDIVLVQESATAKPRNYVNASKE